MRTMPYRFGPSPVGRLRLRLPTVLRPAGGHNPARQGQGSGHVVSHSAVQGQPAQSRDSWFAERAGLGTPLSDEEMLHGYNAGIINAALLM